MRTATLTEKRILSVKVKRMLDTDPDLSDLGVYSSTPAEHHIDREERGDMGRNEYRYFNVGMGCPEYIEQDYKRMEAYNNQEWYMLGIRADAQVILSGCTIQTITSGGLWGIESDSGNEYFGEVEQEELADLREQLEAVGFSTEEISAAFENVKHVQE